ncbi:MAG: hypothetical protein DHS20C14_05870 [Phycisphaeraceae bacterium]|nr:MAG: hypothetical protein DHS20C14_05870 [Phycisphaeraceae bacterium]
MRVKIRAAVVGVVCAMGAAPAWAQHMDPNLDPNHPGVETGPERVHAGEDWQIAREECIDGLLYYVVEDAEAYIVQMGWPRARMAVYPRSQTGLSKDLIVAPRVRGGGTQRRCEPKTRRWSSSGSSSHTQVTLAWNAAARRFDVSVTHSKSSSSSRGRTPRLKEGPPIDGQYVPGYVEPDEPVYDDEGNLISAEQPALSLVELARTELGVGEAEQAVILYRGHLEVDPDDARARRELGVALLKSGEGSEGALEIAEAYLSDPSLARDALGTWIVGDSPLAMGRIRGEAVKLANREETAAAWLTVVVLMQAEGKTAAAEKMIGRAEEKGLDAEVARAMRGVLNQP